MASPLLVPSNDFVKLYFQVDAANKAFSPNCPSADQNDSALSNGMTPELIDRYRSRLQDFQLLCDNNSLATLVPQLPSLAAPLGQSSLAMAAGGNGVEIEQQDQASNQPQQA